MTKEPREVSHPRDIRTALLDAAEAVLVREGPAAVTVRAVAAEAGVAPMGVYNRFGGKEGLVDALLIRGFEGLHDAVRWRGETDPLERLRQSGLRYRAFALAHPEHYAAMFGGALARGEPSPALEECAGGTFAALVEHVGVAMAAGRLRPGDPRDVAQQIWSAVHGAIALEIGGRVLADDAEENYQALMDVMLRGLLLTGPQPDGGPGPGPTGEPAPEPDR
jgi:AcrR family transcriptional regulator